MNALTRTVSEVWTHGICRSEQTTNSTVATNNDHGNGSNQRPERRA